MDRKKKSNNLRILILSATELTISSIWSESRAEKCKITSQPEKNRDLSTGEQTEKTESSIVEKFILKSSDPPPIKFHDVVLFLIKQSYNLEGVAAQRLEEMGQVVKKIARRPLRRGYAVTYAVDDRENRYDQEKAPV